MKNALKLGLIMAAISSLVGLVIYLVDYCILFDWKFSLILFVTNMVIAVLLGRKFLRPTDYVGLSYGEALKYLFVAFLISSVIGAIFQVAVYGSNEQFEQDFIQYSKDASITGLAWGMGLAGQSEAEIELAVEKMKDQMESGEIPEPESPYQWSKLPIMLFGSIFVALILSLIVAIFVKQKG